MVSLVRLATSEVELSKKLHGFMVALILLCILLHEVLCFSLVTVEILILSSQA